MAFKDFSRTYPKIQGLFKTVRTLLLWANQKIYLENNEYFFSKDRIELS